MTEASTKRPKQVSGNLAKPNFAINAMAMVKHINMRKEGPQDKRLLAVDVQLSFANLDRSICRFFDPALEAFLWRTQGGELVPRNEWLEPPVYGNVLHGAIMQIDKDIFSGCEVRKFTLVPMVRGVVNLSCGVSFNPGTKDVTHLARLVQDQAMVFIAGPNDLFS